MIRYARIAPVVGAVGIAAIAAIHLLWATGSSWPYRDRGELAEQIAGRPDMPSARACVLVGGALAGAATVVAVPGRRRWPIRVARAGVAAGLLVRGVAGVAGRTDLLLTWTPSEEFVRKDRRFYGPLCLVLAALSAISLRQPRGITKR
ncbi:MAG TPA: DUF3995 domain-containing protein [Galbitalea sp.]|jgi:hypothetical protein|nr:DUF3995 domain-containing protein [Galbitalea sp.]